MSQYDYVVIENHNLRTFREEVLKLRSEGWIYVGGVYVTPETDDHFKCYYQAMERVAEEQPQ